MSKELTRRQRWVRRLRRTFIVAAVLFGITGVLYAVGDSGSGQLGQTPPSMAWIQLSDDKGVDAWQYELAIKTDFWEPGKAVSAMLTDFLWGVYRGIVLIAIWFLDWVISFDWLNLLVDPLLTIGEALSNVIDQLGLVPVFLLITGFVAALHLLRGRYATSIYEVAIAGIVIALAGGLLANPVQMVAGPGGWIYQTRDATMELVGAMDGQAATDQNSVTSALLKTFVRQPAQIVAFGKVLDGTGCEAEFDEAVLSGPHGYDSTIRDAIRDCDEDAFNYADNPSGGMVVAVGTLLPSSIIIIAMAVIIGGFVMLAMVSVAVASLKGLVNLVTAVLPGGARRPLMQSAADIVIGLTIFVFSMFFLMVFLLVVQSLFTGAEGDPMQAFMITNILLIIGIVMFVGYRKRLKAAAGRLADFLAKRPGAPLPRSIQSGRNMGRAALGVGAYQALRSPRTRKGLVKGLATAGTAAAAVATGNPALAARLAFNHGAKAVAKRGTRKAVDGAVSKIQPGAGKSPAGDSQVPPGAAASPGTTRRIRLTSNSERPRPLLRTSQATRSTSRPASRQADSAEAHQASTPEAPQPSPPAAPPPLTKRLRDKLRQRIRNGEGKGTKAAAPKVETALPKKPPAEPPTKDSHPKPRSEPAKATPRTSKPKTEPSRTRPTEKRPTEAKPAGKASSAPAVNSTSRPRRPAAATRRNRSRAGRNHR